MLQVEAMPKERRRRRSADGGRKKREPALEERAPKKRDEGTRPRAEPTAHPSEPPSASPRPWWLIGAIAAVIAIVVLVRWNQTETTNAHDTERTTVEDVGDPTPETVEYLEPRIIRRYPHDRRAFTQGLLWHDGHLYESTGLEGRSSLRRVELSSGRVLARHEVPRPHFAEGLALAGDRLFQLTWQSGRAFVYRRDDFSSLRTFEYEGEGWGLCHDGHRLVMSNGSAELVFRDPNTFREVRRVTARLDGEPVERLNELECVQGVVWANVWQQDRIVRIDPRNGVVTAVVDASGLLSEEEANAADVLNGIAWIPERRHFVITGKLWPHLFEVTFERAR